MYKRQALCNRYPSCLWRLKVKESISKTPFLPQKIVHITFLEESVDLRFFAGDEVYLHAVDYSFDSEVACDSHVSFLVTIWLSSHPFVNRV